MTMVESRTSGFRGLRVLVAEDEYLVADDLCRELQAAGADVLGPAPTVASALDLLASTASVDLAILDVNLGGEIVVPVADALRARAVRFVFATGYDAWAMPATYGDALRCEKPIDLETIAGALFP